MWFLKILIMLFLLEGYQCKDIVNKVNATHCEFTRIRPVTGKKVAHNVTFMEKGRHRSTGNRVVVKTVLRVATETVKKLDCCPGYKKVGPKKICTPKCDQVCENSKCTAPNECSCNDGYKKFTANRCIPECESCERGRCVGPNICECYHSYHKNESGQCVPTCKDACENGWCSEPDICTCHVGFEVDKTNTHKCNPICTSSCIQGICTAPDVCDCHPGYEFKNGSKTECLPVCDFCESGNCTGPSNCTCWDNYEEHIIVQGEKIVKVCQPKCENECINGICIEVDTCSCKKGYNFVKDSIDVCEPICEPECQNGVCESPDVCSCDPGYKNVEHQCVPHCESECVNAFCADPNRCECMLGYRFKSNSTNDCEAFCENCTDGVCVEPNVCECLDGFQITDDNVCEKMCSQECVSGVCVNGSCFCSVEFQLVNQSICLPLDETTTAETIQSISPFENDECIGTDNCENICGDVGCTNGICTSPGICKCFEGFELDPANTFVCVLEKITSVEKAHVKAIITNYISLIIALLIIFLMATTLIFLLNRRSCKVNYNVDEKERKVGVKWEDNVHYVINKDDQAFA